MAPGLTRPRGSTCAHYKGSFLYGPRANTRFSLCPPKWPQSELLSVKNRILIVPTKVAPGLRVKKVNLCPSLRMAPEGFEPPTPRLRV